MDSIEAPDTAIQNALEQLQSAEEGTSLLILDADSNRGVVFFTTDSPTELMFSFASPARDQPREESPGGEILLSEEEVVRLRALLDSADIEHYSAVMPHPNQQPDAHLSLIEGCIASPSEGKPFIDRVFTEVYLLDPPQEYTILSD
ncbi:hypothetical protein FEM03_22950 [Phragmitibacter flavus]|uniref:Uncharacterized protein n=1 Tax=Phragmitibacter flavus TaxID=2576071 RepID=A0A5R8K8U3_9BACT|nr:hypothetical protein [Phragmitibacter flavus]TLD68365.1 hypothetical protein FEM03_22950 [Phragmitibacter flavus]